MTEKLLATFVTMIVSAASLAVTILKVDPEGQFFFQGMVGIFVSLFFFIVSFCTLFLFFGKELFVQKNMNLEYFWRCVRRSFFLSVAIILSLLLAHWNMFSVIELFLILLFFILFESICIFSKKKSSRSY